MNVFLTGATGFIGSHIIPLLQAAGHQVTGLVRSDAAAQQLQAIGVKPHQGTLEAPETIASAVANADAVIHTAFDHHFERMAENCEKDKRVILALGAALLGTSKPLIITSGVGIGDPGNGGLANEQVVNLDHPNPRVATEIAGNQLLEQGIDVRVVRLPQVHDTHRQGLITPYIHLAKANGFAGYVGNGQSAWSACHVDDVARLYLLVLELGEKGQRYHAVAETSVTSLSVAQVVGAKLNIAVKPVDNADIPHYYGWFAMFAGLDLSASGVWTQSRLQWSPAGPMLLDDLNAMDYSAL